jgi:D-hydroxyproline dehydrogenase subunit gamma
MFHKRREAMRQTVTVLVEGVPVSLSAGESAAAAALLAGLDFTRSSAVSGVPRAPYCMMGVCFECLMVIDGIASRQACLVPVREGMQIARQDSRRGLGP